MTTKWTTEKFESEELGCKKSANQSPLDRVTTVKGYALAKGLHIRTVQRMVERGEINAKNEYGIWLIEIDDRP